MKALLLCVVAMLVGVSHGSIDTSLILEYRLAHYRSLSAYNIRHDHLRKKLLRNPHPVPPPPPLLSCHNYAISANDCGPEASTVVCVEYTDPSLCHGKHGQYFSLLSTVCFGSWRKIGHLLSCTCSLVTENYVFV